MRRPAALEIALALAERPASSRWASRMPLPTGVTFLLEVATGEQAALSSAQIMTMRSQNTLQAAAAFFIEQVLFTNTADSYRVLGTTSGATRRELRRHMALLVKWLHPDTLVWNAHKFDVDRTIFIHRVTRAWEDLKYDQRRAAYDRRLTAEANGIKRRRAPQYPALERKERLEDLISYNSNEGRASRRLAIYKIEGDTLFGRLVYYLMGHA